MELRLNATTYCCALDFRGALEEPLAITVMVSFSLLSQGNSGGDGPAGPPGERVRVFQAWAMRGFPGRKLAPNILPALHLG